MSKGQYLIRYGCDILLWALCIIATGFLAGAGVIDNPELALAGTALFWAIRANSKRGV
ncbi:MAG TPA: hypothetical protein VN155_16865 [Devosia sp.]|nr:hypothetical protein [Devosia sp.]